VELLAAFGSILVPPVLDLSDHPTCTKGPYILFDISENGLRIAILMGFAMPGRQLLMGVAILDVGVDGILGRIERGGVAPIGD
jgi:hypothetical protein